MYPPPNTLSQPFPPASGIFNQYTQDSMGAKIRKPWTNSSITTQVRKKKSSGLAGGEFEVVEILSTEKVNLPERPVPFLFICMKTNNNCAKCDCA